MVGGLIGALFSDICCIATGTALALRSYMIFVQVLGPHLCSKSGFGLALNGALLAQIVWFGAVVAEKPLLAVLSADFVDDVDVPRGR